MMAWLRVSQGNKIKFLKYLDVEEEPRLMEKVLRAIFRFSQSDEEVEELIQVSLSLSPSESLSRSYSIDVNLNLICIL